MSSAGPVQPIEDPSADPPAAARGRSRGGGGAAALIAAITVSVALAGALGTDADSDWYRSLEKPSFNPPGWLFGPVWTSIYVLTAISAWISWRDAEGTRRTAIAWTFAANAALNVAWTYIFFRGRSPEWAGVEIVILLLTIFALIRMTWSVNRTAALLLLPYAAWVSFATLLNWSIAAAN